MRYESAAAAFARRCALVSLLLFVVFEHLGHDSRVFADASLSTVLADSESWEQIAKNEIEARAQDKKKMASDFAQAELERVQQQHNAEAALRKKYSDVHAELDSTKNRIFLLKSKLKDTLASLAESESMASKVATSLLEEKEAHVHDVNSWRHAAREIIYKAKKRLRSYDMSDKLGKDKNTRLSSTPMSLLDAEESIVTPSKFETLTTALLDTQEAQQAALNKKLTDRQKASIADGKLHSSPVLDMTHDAEFERELDRYVPGQSRLPGVDTSTGLWPRLIKNRKLAAQYPTIPAFQ